jgi:hypothetical protein
LAVEVVVDFHHLDKADFRMVAEEVAVVLVVYLLTH